jgi:hypothetical protein
MATKTKPRPKTIPSKKPVAKAAKTRKTTVARKAVPRASAARTTTARKPVTKKPSPKPAARIAATKKPAVSRITRPRPSSARGKPTPITLAQQEKPPAPPATPEEFQSHIRVIGDRVFEHIVYMCEVEGMPGSSAEAKRKALTSFHGRLVAMETELGRIKEELQLG